MKYFQKYAICLHASGRMIQHLNPQQGMLKESVCDVFTSDHREDHNEPIISCPNSCPLHNSAKIRW